jgi:predicted RNase H-like HicB family nuclease
MRGHMHGEAEREPTWEEANAAFEAAEPAELIRPARKLVVVYRYVDGSWRANSPDLQGFEVLGRSLSEAKAKAAENLAAFLDPGVELDEQVAEPQSTAPPQDPHIRDVILEIARDNPYLSPRAIRRELRRRGYDIEEPVVDCVLKQYNLNR